AAQEDPSRFAELYERNFGRVYAYIARRVRDRVDVQDLTSHVFHQALANIKRFEWRGAPFAAWLYKVAPQAIIAPAAKKAREQNLPKPDEAVDEGGEKAILDGIERRARLFKFVSRLPEDQRRVINMRFAEEKSIREIALHLGRTEGAVKQLQFRALEALRARMGGGNG